MLILELTEQALFHPIIAIILSMLELTLIFIFLNLLGKAKGGIYALEWIINTLELFIGSLLVQFVSKLGNGRMENFDYGKMLPKERS